MRQQVAKVHTIKWKELAFLKCVLFQGTKDGRKDDKKIYIKEEEEEEEEEEEGKEKKKE